MYAAIVCLCVLGLLVLLFVAARKRHLVGRRVMTIQWDTEAREGSRVVRKLKLGEVYEVGKVNGELLWFNESVGGWVHRRDVVPFAQAIDHFDRLVQQDPLATNYCNRAIAWQAQDELDNALGDLNVAIRLDPIYAPAYSGKAWLLATSADAQYRDGAKAVELATNACELTNWQNADCLGALAAAYAESGGFDQAVHWQTKAIDLAPASEKPGYQHGLNLYRAGKPYTNE